MPTQKQKDERKRRKNRALELHGGRSRPAGAGNQVVPAADPAGTGNQVVPAADPAGAGNQVVPGDTNQDDPAAANHDAVPAAANQDDPAAANHDAVPAAANQDDPAAANQDAVPAATNQDDPAATNQVVPPAPSPPPPSDDPDAEQVGSSAPPPLSAAQVVSTPSASQVVLLPPAPAPPRAAADADNPSNNKKPLLSVGFSIDNFTLEVGGCDLLINTSLKFQPKRKYALVGPSGSGKSTLLEAINNRKLAIPKDMTVYHLADVIDESDLSLLETVLGYNPEEEIRRLQERIADLPPEVDKEELYKRLDNIGPKGHFLACKILAGFGFDSYMLHNNTKGLTESWRMKIAITKALCSRADMLLMENPTKYLDFEACAWLEMLLKDLEIIQVIVSNCESFLEICTDVIQINMQDKMIVQCCDTRYKDYLVQKSQKIAEVATISKFSFAQPKGMYKGVKLIQCSNVECGYQNKPVFRNLSLDIEFGSKICLIGGPGKTTLLKFLADKITKAKGVDYRLTGIRIESFEQHSVGTLNQEKTAIKYMKTRTRITNEASLTTQASNYGLSKEVLKQKIKNLSDCQKTSLIFSAIRAKNPHLLLLDEPTSHLDSNTIDCLAKELKKWSGAFVIAGHDLRLISLVADEIWICENGGITKLPASRIMSHRNEMLEKADNERNIVRLSSTTCLFPLFSIGSYRNMSMPFISYKKYIDYEDNSSREPTISLDKFIIRRHMTASVPCNSLEEGFLMIPGEVVCGNRYRVTTEAAKKITSSFLEPLWMLETVGLCFSDFSKENLFVTPSGQVKFRSVQLLVFSEAQMERNLASACSVLDYLFSSDGEKPPEIKYLLDQMKNCPEKRELFHVSASLVPLSNYGNVYLKLYGCLYYKIERTLREKILQDLPHVEEFETSVQSNILLKTYFDHEGGGKYTVAKPQLGAGQTSLTACQEKLYRMWRAEKLTVYLKNRVSHRMDHFGKVCKYLPEMGDLAAIVRFPLVNCYLQEKLFDVGET